MTVDVDVLSRFMKRLPILCSPVTQRLGEFFAQLREIWALLRDVRLTLIILIGTSVVLIGLDQGNDVMRDLVDTANATQVHWPPQPYLLRWVALFTACVLAGLNAWYWSHLLYKSGARGAQPAPRWYVALRQLCGVTPLLAAAVAMPVSAHWRLEDIWFGASLFIGGAFLLFGIFKARPALSAKLSSTGISAPTRFAEGRFVVGDVVFFFGTLTVSVVLYIIFLIPGLRTTFAIFLGPAAVVFFAVACIIPVTSLAIWLTQAHRVPILTLGIIAFVVSSLVNDNHGIRTLDIGSRATPRVGLEVAYEHWKKGVKADEPLVIVATAGGASRAAYWTGTVLRALDEKTEFRFSKHVFAISGVSGGTLGAVGYVNWLSTRPEQKKTTSDDDAKRATFLQRFLGEDFLSPTLAGLLYGDLLQRFVPFPLFPSRATYLEEAWESAWDEAESQCGKPCGKVQAMSRDFLSVWDGLLNREAKTRTYEAKPWIPMVFANGTHVQSGKRIITAPVTIAPAHFDDAIDFFEVFGYPIRTSTAILNSARFPIVSPAGRISGHLGTKGHLVDGGYFENGGLETAYDIVRAIREIEKNQKIVIVEISNDDSVSDQDRFRHGKDKTPLPVTLPSTWDSPWLGEVTAIVQGLYNTRSARGILSAKRMSKPNLLGVGQVEDQVEDQVEYYAFPLLPICMDQLPKFAAHCADFHKVSMSWLESIQTKYGMDVRLTTDNDQIEGLVDVLELSARFANLTKQLMSKAIATYEEKKVRSDLEKLANRIKLDREQADPNQKARPPLAPRR